MSARPLSAFPDPARYGFAGRMASLFIDSKLTPIIVAASLLLGLFAVLMLPREEEPQINVPMFDVMVPLPGSSAREVSERVVAVGERKLMEIPGVEYMIENVSENSKSGQVPVIVSKKATIMCPAPTDAIVH